MGGASLEPKLRVGRNAPGCTFEGGSGILRESFSFHLENKKRLTMAPCVADSLQLSLFKVLFAHTHTQFIQNLKYLVNKEGRILVQ